MEPGQMEWVMEVEEREQMNRDRLEGEWRFHCSRCSAHCSKGLFIAQRHCVGCVLLASYLLCTASRLLYSNLAAIYGADLVIEQNKYTRVKVEVNSETFMRRGFKPGTVWMRVKHVPPPPYLH